MSMDKSLKSKNMLVRHRNVLTRAERVQYLMETDVWTDDSSPFGMPKIVHRKAAVGKKDKVAKKEGEEESTEGAAPAETEKK